MSLVLELCPQSMLFGNCLMASQGQAPARRAGFRGGLPAGTGAETLWAMPLSMGWSTLRPKTAAPGKPGSATHR